MWFVPVAGFLRGGELLFRSVLRLAMADFFLFLSSKETTDSLSSKSIRLEFWAMAHAAVSRFGVPCRKGRWTWIVVVAAAAANWRPTKKKMKDLVVIFFFFEDQFAFGRMYCALDYV